MKVIFLDFDGVINNWDSPNIVNIENVEVLKLIQKEANAKIVATTSNKYSFQRPNGVSYCESSYYKYVIELTKLGIVIDDITPYSKEQIREEEINLYLKSHPEIEQYVILDDEYIGSTLKQHQVFLDLYKGLQLEHVAPTLKILNGQLGFYPIEQNTSETAEQRNIRINQYYNKVHQKLLK